MHPRLLTEMIVIAALKRAIEMAQLREFSEDRFSCRSLTSSSCHEVCPSRGDLKSAHSEFLTGESNSGNLRMSRCSSQGDAARKPRHLSAVSGTELT